MKYVKPIAIDLGAQNTGVWTALYSLDNNRNDPAECTNGYTVSVDKNAMTFMMPERTAMRHMRRAYKRRKLAKLLVRLWLADRWPTSDDEEESKRIEACQRYVMGLMNRRGFTHFSLEEKLDSELIDGFAGPLESLGIDPVGLWPSEWVMAVAANPEDAAEMLKRPIFTLFDRKPNKKKEIEKSTELTDHVKNKLTDLEEDMDVGGMVKAINHMRECLQFARDSAGSGHKPRADYFVTIREDIENTDIGKRTCELLNMRPDELVNLIGHIGNLNLPALRSYFHDRTRETGKSLDVVRFHQAWEGFFDRWSFVGESGRRKSDKQNNLREWRKQLAKASTKDELWALLTQRDPVETIPPFEAQSNRRPPICQSLLLDPDALDEAFPAASAGSRPVWQIWAQKLESRDPDLAEGLDEISENDVKVIHRHVRDSDRLEQQRRWRAARLLQRVLDRTRELDPWKLRLLASERGDTHGSGYTSAREDLTRALGGQHVEGFIELAGQYLAQSRPARSGLWFDREKAGLLRRCGAHPPHKKAMLPRMVCNVLCIALDESASAEVKRIVESEAIGPPAGMAGRRGARKRKIATCVAEFSDLQKKLSGDLRLLYQDAAIRAAEERQRWGKDENRTHAWNAYQWAAAIGACIGQTLGHDEVQVARYGNPYSLAQLNQLLLQDRGGFASNCRACLAENGWRAQLNASGTANASRLPADSVRPFDGMLARLLRAKANRIAGAIAEAFNLPADATALSIPLLLEENRFEFTEQLARLKGVKGKKLDKIARLGESRREEWQQRWRDKWQRIQDAGMGRCPYCGEPIGENGDFDHIASRAGTRDIAGYAFDAEPNLIFAHRTCNARKGRTLYTLDNLQPAYLQAVFGTSDRDVIRRQIATTCEPWLDARADRRAFHQLLDDLQRAVRHALFLPELRNKVLAKIANQNKARVNGTQRWFARQLATALRKAFTRKHVGIPLEFSVHRVPYTDVGELRQRLASEAPEAFEKIRPQPPYSHTVDAALVFALASTDPKVRAKLGLDAGDDASITEFTEPGRAAALLPQSLRVIRIERRPKYADGVKPWHQPLFKANPIGERFVPVGVDSEQRVWVGFSADNRFELPPPEVTKTDKPKADPRLVMLQTLWPVLHTPSDMPEPDLATLAQQAAHREAGIFWLKVDRRKAFEHMLASKHDRNDACTKTLSALLYHVKRADLAEALKLDGKGKGSDKTAPSAAELLKDKDFTINVKLADFKEEGKLILPAKAMWQNLCDDGQLKEHLGKKKLVRQMPENDPKNTAAIDWDKLIKDYFEPRITNKSPVRDRVHRRKQQVYSLPRIASASGGFRTRRLDPDGKPVYQLLQVDKGAYSGFAKFDNAIGFDKHLPQLLDIFERSKHLTPLDPKPRGQQTVPFDQPNVISTQALAELGVSRFELLPASTHGHAVRMTLPWKKLYELLPDIIRPDSFRRQGAELALTVDDARSLARALLAAMGISSLGPRINGVKAAIAIEWMDDVNVALHWRAGTGASRGASTEIASDSEEPSP